MEDIPMEPQIAEIYRNELVEEGYDLPELADTMEEAYARAAADTFLFALRNVQRELDANDAEFDKLQAFNQDRHVARQHGLGRQMEYLRGVVKTLFGFMKVTGKKKSLNLLGGRVGTRAKPDELVIVDEDAVIAWAKAVEAVADLVVIKPRINRKALRAYMESIQGYDGKNKPPGVTLEHKPDEFFATPATD